MVACHWAVLKMYPGWKNARHVMAIMHILPKSMI